MQPTAPLQLEDIVVQRNPHPVRPGLALNVWRVNVLLVEDDEADVELIRRALRCQVDVGSIDVRRAPDVALDDLRTGAVKPTIILLDIHMPKLDGFQFMRRLREIDHMREIPVVLLTTSRSLRDVEEARRSSACAYLVKPDQFEELKMCLDSLIKQAVVGKRRT